MLIMRTVVLLQICCRPAACRFAPRTNEKFAKKNINVHLRGKMGAESLHQMFDANMRQWAIPVNVCCSGPLWMLVFFFGKLDS